MAGRADLQAGAAFVRLYVKAAEFNSGILGAITQLKLFSTVGGAVIATLHAMPALVHKIDDALVKLGKGLVFAGGSLITAGSSMVSVLGAAATQFANFGESIAKMSNRTGIGVTALSELVFAAEVAGTSVEELELGIRAMQQTVTEKGFFFGLSPEKQLEAFADQIAAITDPAQRTAKAVDVFGRAGTRMLPLLIGGASGIRTLRAEAERFGRSITPAEAQAAERLKDAWQALIRSILGVAFAAGSSLADVLTRVINKATEIISIFGRWIRENKELVKIFGIVAAGLIATGAAFATFGAGLFALGKIAGVLAGPVFFILRFITVLKILTLVLGYFGVSLTALLAPLLPWIAGIGAVAAAIAAAAAVGAAAIGTFLALSEPIKNLGPVLRMAGESISKVFGLIAKGEFRQAGLSAVEGIKLVMLGLVKAIIDMARTALERIPSLIKAVFGTFRSGAGGIGAIVSKIFTDVLPAMKLAVETLLLFAKDAFLQLPKFAGYSAGLIVREMVKTFVEFFRWLGQSFAGVFKGAATDAGLFGPKLLLALKFGIPIGTIDRLGSEAAFNAIKGAGEGLFAGAAGKEAPKFEMSPETLAAYKRLTDALGLNSTGGGTGKPSDYMQATPGGKAFVTYSAYAAAGQAAGGGANPMVKAIDAHRKVAEKELDEQKKTRVAVEKLAEGLRFAS